MFIKAALMWRPGVLLDQFRQSPLTRNVRGVGGARGRECQAARFRDLQHQGSLDEHVRDRLPGFDKDILLPGTELKLVLTVGDYEMALKGQVRHGDQHGLGIEFHEIRKGERQICNS